MRCMPLAVWCQRLSDDDQLKAAVTADCSFIHSNSEVHEMVSAYCAAIRALHKFVGKDDRFDKAIQAA